MQEITSRPGKSLGNHIAEQLLDDAVYDLFRLSSRMWGGRKKQEVLRIQRRVLRARRLLEGAPPCTPAR